MKGITPHVALIGKRNSGKSYLINRLTGHDIAIVSDTPGTTTDPVYKNCELLPFGSVKFIDTAGYDDKGATGELRVKKSRKIIDYADFLILVSRPSLFTVEDMLFIKENSSRILVVFTFCDIDDEFFNATFQEKKKSLIEIHNVDKSFKKGFDNNVILNNAQNKIPNFDYDFIKKTGISVFCVSNTLNTGVRDLKDQLVSLLEELKKGELI